MEAKKAEAGQYVPYGLPTSAHLLHLQNQKQT